MGGEGTSYVGCRRALNSRPNVVRYGYCVKQGNVVCLVVWKSDIFWLWLMLIALNQHRVRSRTFTPTFFTFPEEELEEKILHLG